MTRPIRAQFTIRIAVTGDGAGELWQLAYEAERILRDSAPVGVDVCRLELVPSPGLPAAARSAIAQAGRAARHPGAEVI